MTQRVISRPRRRRSGGLAAAIIGIAGIGAFALGFVFFWAVGARVAGGDGLRLPGFSRSGPVTAAAPALPVQSYPVALDVSPRAFRDVTYVPVKGIYLSSYVAGVPRLLNNQLALADRTEINAMVIDIKDATGYVSYAADVPLAKEARLVDPRIKDVDGLVALLRQHHLVPIARLVAFQDPLLSRRRPDLAIKAAEGGLWKDRKGLSYTNPYNQEVWKYLVDVAADAASHGFREIQFDYVRFPSEGNLKAAVYSGENGLPEDAIAGFLSYARRRLEPLGVWVSADVFGLTLKDTNDVGIGQKLEKVAQGADIVCPMVYPSHYYAGSYNVSNPNAHPYEIITAAMKDATRRLDGTGALCRPWLQDFSLGGVRYGVAEVKAQIKAAEEQGFNEWILWDPMVTYTEGALRPAS